MEATSISVTLSVASDAYQRRLPEVLLRRGMLRRVFRFESGLEVLDPATTEALTTLRRYPVFKVANRLVWAAWRRLPGRPSSHLPIAASCWVADRLASRHVPPSTIFHGLTGVSLASLQTARRHGALTILESPMAHLQHWQNQVLAECDRFGIDARGCSAILPAPLIRRALREYELCDRIIVLSSAARRSFERFGHAHKTVVVWPGVDHTYFRPPVEPSRPHPLRVCYVGRVELAKGVGYLLEAWKQLSLPGAELLLVGEIQPEMHTLLRSCTGRNVRLVGRLLPEQVARCYRESNLFVFPSGNEGFGLVLLEAMASGLPVIATEESGAKDCLTQGKDGFVVPPKNMDALAETILWCFKHPHETEAMGRAGRTKVEQQFTLSHYEERLITLYRSEMGMGKAEDCEATRVQMKSASL